MTFDRAVTWLNRFVLVAAAVVMTMIAIRNLQDPIAATRPLHIARESASAVTIARVGFGEFPLGIAAASNLLDRLLTDEQMQSRLVMKP